jgi:pimeloyl-ACP methyl ester carboxylesterase
MPELQRPDGAIIHWEQRGDGPLIVMVLQFFGGASVFPDLIHELARDHRVVTYDMRGVGASTRQGPYDQQTDTQDLIALIEDLGGPALLIPMADGMNRAVRVAAERPDLGLAVLSPGGNPVGREAAQGTEALAGSDSVVEAVTGMVGTDYRGALRALFSNGNPQMTDDQLRDRVQATIDYCPQNVGAERMRHWVDDDIGDLGRKLGGRLWLLEHGTSPWFPLATVEPTRRLLPEAHIEVVEDGAISRPDITAAYARQILQSQAAPTSEGSEQAL